MEQVEEAEEGGEGREENYPPLLAPLAFTGLGMIGLLGTFRRWRAEVIERSEHYEE